MKNYFKGLKILNSSAGFTLIELLVAMSIVSVVLTIAGYGLVAIMTKNQTADTETTNRVNINRALDFISDEVKMANSAIDSSGIEPSWSWRSIDNSGLGGNSVNATAQLYLQIPLSVVSMTASTDLINIPNHNFSSSNAVMFTGANTIAGGLSTNTVYYVVTDGTTDASNFKVASSLANAASNTAIDLTSNSSGNVIANRLLIYYIRDNTTTWLGAKTVNRSAGPCSTSSNCPVLVDSIANNGFTATVANLRQVSLTLTGQLDDKTPSPTLLSPPVSTTAFARSNF